jgi:hypothetical protein
MSHVIHLEHWSELAEKDKGQLLKFPAYITLLACLHDDGMDDKEKKIALRITHIKTFTSPPLLADFYRAAEQVFDENLTAINDELPHSRPRRELVIHTAITELEKILLKLGPHYASALHDSMRSYTRYVSRAHNNVLEYFIFPMPIKGLSD